MALPDLFPGFDSVTVDTGEARIFARVGGPKEGRPLVLLHGFPQTHVMWAPIAGELAKSFRVVVPDLRGYGWSQVAEVLPNHQQMSKRAMAHDVAELMRELGHAKFAVAGHDRGGRCAYRLALDHAAKITRLAVLDIVPTSVMWASMDAAFAMKVYHWMFLAQTAPLPETMIGKAPTNFLDMTMASWTAAKNLSAFSSSALAHYRAAINVPDRIAAMCEDYRAGYYFDRAIDEQDRANGRKIACPTLVLWGKSGIPSDAVDTDMTPLSVWKDWADNLSGRGIDGGHFIVEENPAATLEALLQFFSTP